MDIQEAVFLSPFFFFSFLNAAGGLGLAKLNVYPPQVYHPPFISN